MSDIPVDPNSRRQRGLCIINHPDRWKVCEACEGLVAAPRAVCPHCRAYRFDRRETAVRAAVTRALKRGHALPA